MGTEPLQPFLAVLDYGIGNLRSAQKGFERVGADVRLSNDPALIADAVGLVLPGVGHFGSCMKELRASKLDEVAMSAIEAGKPFLGICVGMQMLFESSEEGSLEGLGIFKGKVKNFKSFETNIKTPHIGWNTISVETTSRILNSIESSSDFYFVHSFFVPIENIYKDTIKSITSYGLKFVSCMEQENIFCTQFHPEKSQNSGLKIIENFIKV